MSYNPDVAYAGPDGATRSVTDELTAKFGAPDRPYEFVTGWKSPDNVSGHNPDSNGITHGVDIFMTPERNRWAADHLAARGRAGDPRVGYVIYAGQIASPSTGYEFAGSGWEHWDHPHLSVWDGYWGGPCALPASIYNDTSSWGIASGTITKPLGSKPTPIQEDDELSNDQVERIINEVNAAAEAKHKVTREAIAAVAGQVVDRRFPRISTNGKVSGEATISTVLGAHDANVVLTRGVVTGAAEAVAKTVAAINPAAGIDPEDQGRRAAAAFLAEVEGLRLTITPAEADQ